MTSAQILSILLASGIVAAVGLVVGLFLGVAGKIFAVKTDERVDAVREALPGNNCGGCGYSGCDALAKAIADGTAPIDACPVGGQTAVNAIAEVLGVEATTATPRVAFVKCSGTCDKTRFLYDYYGDDDCHRVALAPGRGSKACAWGCTGLGSCVKACPFGAISVVDGCAKVNPAACRACGVCVATCPHHLIELIPVTATQMVRCASREKGKAVREMCDAGCIGCGLCARLCPTGAVTVVENLAHIDQDQCIGCGKCAAKCPAKVIVNPGNGNPVTVKAE